MLAARDWRSVQGQRVVGMTPELRGIDVFVSEPPVQQIRIAREVPLEQIAAATMHRHGRRIGKRNAASSDELEALVFAARLARIGLENQRDRLETIAMLVTEFGAELEQQCQAVRIQRLAGTHDRTANRLSAERMQPARDVELSLEARTLERVLDVGCTKPVQHVDDAVAPEVGGIAGILVQELRMARDQCPHRCHVVAPDRIGHATREHEARPSGETVAASQDELRVGQRRGFGRQWSGMVLPQRRRGVGIPPSESSK